MAKSARRPARRATPTTSPAVPSIPFADAYPRPQMRRAQWTNLNGTWDFAINAAGDARRPEDVAFGQSILVPFAPETPLSSVNATGFYQAVWYRRTFDAARPADGGRVILHFGAVDYEATVWLNGHVVATHEGGYTPFHTDVTDALIDGPQTLIVRAADDPHDLSKPRGKQDWVEVPRSIWYYRTTGIWQTAWLEVVPATHVKSVRWSCDLPTFSLSLQALLGGLQRDGLRLRVRLSIGEQTLSDDIYSFTRDELSRVIKLPDPGIDAARHPFLWFPWKPTLIDAELMLLDDAGFVIETIQSYTALREANLLGTKFVLNSYPCRLDLVLDQGYWTEGGLTAPDDAAYQRDVELAKQMGFNGVRKHQKIENPRFLYWADVLGLFVWEEMPSPYRFNDRAIERTTGQWMDAVKRDVSHPCIVGWVPFNESWGVPDLPHAPAQRRLVEALYTWTKAYDPTRMVSGNDGWENGATDFVSVHDYEAVPEKLLARYGVDIAIVEDSFSRIRPGNRVLILEGYDLGGLPIMLTEFGGIAYSRDEARTWGYSRAASGNELALRYFRLMEAVRAVPHFAGFCYTQFADTYQEANGLLYMDRTPKFPLDQICVSTRGPIGREETAVYEAMKSRAMMTTPSAKRR